jgi:hypothetical protein
MFFKGVAMLSRITLVCLPLLALLAGCASSEKTHSNKDVHAEGVSENTVSEEAGSEETDSEEAAEVLPELTPNAGAEAVVAE